MKQTEVTYLSSNGKTPIHMYIWEPEMPPKAILQVTHGITEHIGRYLEFARYFTELGYIVAGNDNIGHGLSQDPDNPKPMYFGPKGSWKYIENDIAHCRLELKERFPELPHCLVGLSLGSFAVHTLLIKRSDITDAAILAGTGHISKIEAFLANFLVKREEKRFGDSVNTPLVQKLTMGDYNAKFKPCRTDSDWLCSDEAAVDAYIADPLCGNGFTVGSFRDLLEAMAFCSDSSHMKEMNKNIPIFLLSGKCDPVGNSGKGVETIFRSFQKHGIPVEMRLFEGMRHDIFRETERISVFTAIETWLAKVFSKQ